MTVAVGELFKLGFVSVAAVSLTYQLLAAFSRDAPLRETFNPKRLRWGVAAVTLLSGVYGLLGRAAGYDWEPPAVWAVVAPALTGGATPPDVLIPCAVGGLGLIVLGFVAFCYAVYPKDPSAFQLRHPLPEQVAAQAARAIRYYTRRPGGLVYAALLVVPRDGNPPAVAELLAAQRTKADPPPPYLLIDFASRGELNPDALAGRNPDADRTAWLELARRVYAQGIVQVIECRGCGLGMPNGLRTTTEGGGVILEYLHPPRPPEPDYLLFAVTHSPIEVSSRRFEDHFATLRDAIRRIIPDKSALGPVHAPVASHDAATVVLAASAVAHAGLPAPPSNGESEPAPERIPL